MHICTFHRIHNNAPLSPVILPSISRFPSTITLHTFSRHCLFEIWRSQNWPGAGSSHRVTRRWTTTSTLSRAMVGMIAWCHRRYLMLYRTAWQRNRKKSNRLRFSFICKDLWIAKERVGVEGSATWGRGEGKEKMENGSAQEYRYFLYTVLITGAKLLVTSSTFLHSYIPIFLYVP